MIKVNVKVNKTGVYEIVIKGHAGYDVAGKDIVCAAVSTMAITTVNAILSLEDTIIYEEKAGLLKIRVIKGTEVNSKLLNNLVELLKELQGQYPKNIEIRNED